MNVLSILSLSSLTGGEAQAIAYVQKLKTNCALELQQPYGCLFELRV